MERSLGPRNVGDILKETFTIYKNNFWRLAAVVGIVTVPLFIISFVINLMTNGEGISSHAALPVSYYFVLIPLYFFSFVAGILMQGAIIHAISEQYFYQPLNVGRAYSFAWRRTGSMVLAVFLTVLALTGIIFAAVIFALFFYLPMHQVLGNQVGVAISILLAAIGILAVIYLGITWAFILQTASLEHCGATDAMSRSAALVKKNWWRVLGIVLLFGIILWAIVTILLIPLIIIAAASAITGAIPEATPELPTWLLICAMAIMLIAYIIATPIFTTGETLLYFDLRVRKEQYSLDGLSHELELPSMATEQTTSPPE
jgi:hypothetical protein